MRIYLYVGGTVPSWLVQWTLEGIMGVWALALDIVLCSWARHLALLVPLSTQMYEWLLVNVILHVGRVRAWKPGKSWDFVVALEKGCWSWKVLEICLTLVRNMKCMEDSKESQHCDLGSERVNVNFRVLEKYLSSRKVLKICFQKRAQTLARE